MSEIITHYTGGEAFTNILLKSSIRFGDVSCMNDYNESKFGFSRLRNKMSFSDIEGIDKDIGRKIDEHNENTIKKIDENEKYKCFALCFSTDEDSLCMWNYYLKGNNIGGYNIGFNKEEFISYIYNNIVSKIPNAVLLHGKMQYCKDGEEQVFYDNFVNLTLVEYLKSDTNAMQLISLCEMLGENSKIQSDEERQKIFRGFKEFGENLERESDETTLSFVYERTKCGDKINPFWMNYFIKGYGFRDEREYRIIIAIPTETLDTEQNNKRTKLYGYGTTYANGMIKPFISVNFDKTSIKKIVISPYNSNRNPIKNTKEFCDNLEINAEIKTSNLTVEF